ncbi:protein PFC0760c-like isoform X2 [Pseudomyrmex gracilis]|uniref:protein PFC0760c-like isoform X2 n=1 Tax=Pseudomyrmex gracilis TaxID=219809 RepID=UPI0009952E1C|nr:protein PFC0760c-like isoform X2 [Pseudomyrmex gracilis]
MDDVNINEIYLEEVEVEVNADGDKWIRLNWKEKTSDNDKGSQSTEEESNTETVVEETKDNDIKKPSTETEDDGISVISESDEDNKNENALQICSPSNSRTSQVLQILKYKSNNTKTNVRNIITAFAVGILCGYALSYIVSVPIVGNDYADAIVTCKNASGDNLSKNVEEVKTTLDKIEARILNNEKLLTQLSQLNNFSNQTNKKFAELSSTAEYFNESHPLDDFHIFMNILSSLTIIHDNNNSLKNEMNETLNIINNVKTFYETLVLFDNDTQNMGNSTVLKVLQDDRDNIATKSKSFLSNIKKTINKIMSHIHKKYIKIRNKLNKRVCYLKNQYPNDKGLKLTENNQLFDDKYCFPKTSRKLNDEINTKDDKKYKQNNKRKEHYDQQDNSFKKKLLQDLDNSATPKKHKTESFFVIKNKYDTSTKPVKHRNSKDQFAEERSRPMEKDNFKRDDFTKNVLNHNNASTERRDIPPQKKVENHEPRSQEDKESQSSPEYKWEFLNRVKLRFDRGCRQWKLVRHLYTDYERCNDLITSIKKVDKSNIYSQHDSTVWFFNGFRYQLSWLTYKCGIQRSGRHGEHLTADVVFFDIEKETCLHMAESILKKESIKTYSNDFYSNLLSMTLNSDSDEKYCIQWDYISQDNTNEACGLYMFKP